MWRAVKYGKMMGYLNIGRYQIESELGKGGMGAVLLGYDPVLKRKVAIKCVRIDAAENDAERQALEARLVREAEAAAKLRHPGIVAIHDIIQSAGSAYIVMEFVPGRMLSELTAPGQPADTALMARVVSETAAALDHAHTRKIIHRDIKPSNIMVDETGAVRITDFGIAKIIGAQTQTDPGMAIGTLEYMSPEQLGAGPLDGRADQFSLAVVAYRMLTGRPAFDAPTIRSLAVKIATEIPAPASRVNPRLPRAVDAVLAKALAKNRMDRYETCAAFATALERALSVRLESSDARRDSMRVQDRMQEQQIDPPTTMERPKRPVPTGWIVGAVAAAGVIAATVYFTRTPSKETTPIKTAGPTPAPVLTPRPLETGPPASPSPGQIWQNPKDQQPYAWIPTGSFMMGCVTGDPACEADEKPAREVRIEKGFWMGQAETSVLAYKRYIAATHSPMPPAPSFDAAWSEDDRPIVQITWAEATAFCEWAGGKLPAPEQWEYAARGGVNGQIYATGNRVTASDANFAGVSSREGTMPVIGFKPNSWGLYQMSGNVAEWTNEAQGGQRVVRGGSWNTYPEGLRLSKRVAVDPERRNFTFGVRCVLP